MKEFVLGLTLLRIILSPLIFIFSVFLETNWLALAFFLIAAATDYYDGYLARKYNVESRLGAILDPIADKVLLVFAIFSVVLFTENDYVALIGAFILGREFWVSALREFASKTQQHKATKVTFIAKTKTSFQFIALGMYFFAEAANLPLISFLANFFLFLAMMFAYKSALEYTQNLINK